MRYRFGGLTFGGLIHGGAYFRNFTVCGYVWTGLNFASTLPRQENMKKGIKFSLNLRI